MLASPAGQQRQFAVRRFEESPREHPDELRRRIHWQIERGAGNSLFALFAAVLPARSAVLDFEALFDRRFHVIVAFAFVLDRHTGGVEFPGRHDLIAAPAIVVGILDAHRSAGFLPSRSASRPGYPG